MVAKTLGNTITDKTERRLKVYKDHQSKTRETTYEYSGGTEITTEKTGDGIPGVLKEVREVVKVKTPKPTFTSPWRDQDHYDRVFRKGKYAI